MKKYLTVSADSNYGTWTGVYKKLPNGTLLLIAATPPTWAGTGVVGRFDGKTIEDIDAAIEANHVSRAELHDGSHSATLDICRADVDRPTARKAARAALALYPHDVEYEKRYREIFGRKG